MEVINLLKVSVAAFALRQKRNRYIRNRSDATLRARAMVRKKDE
jgi:hypothetical protein